MRHIIVTSDDCGLSEGINQATLDLFQEGLVTAASVITNFPAFFHALDVFTLYPDLEIGVHLNLTDGKPITAVVSDSGLVNSNGKFASPSSLFYHSIFPRAKFLRAVELEIVAQIKKLTSAGIQPKHLTTHLHFHAIPSLRKIVQQQATNYNIPWIRPHRLSATVLPFNPILDRNQISIDMGNKPVYLVVLKYWLHQNLHRLESILAELDSSIELVVHPCYSEDTTYPKNVKYLPSERFKEVQLLRTLHSHKIL
jgi:chitin disaccharide deacetylase